MDVGTQYPVRLQTKLQPLIELARAAGAEARAWTYKESESQNLNPNSGKPYMNRYLERVDLPGDAPDSEPDATVTQSAAKAPQTPGPSSEGMTKEEWGAQGRRHSQDGLHQDGGGRAHAHAPLGPDARGHGEVPAALVDARRVLVRLGDRGQGWIRRDPLLSRSRIPRVES